MFAKGGSAMNEVKRRMIVAASVLILIGASYRVASGEVIDFVNENFDSYPDGAWPTGFYQFQYNYERYPGTHVVSGVTPAPPSTPKCLMVTNPYNGWGDDVSVPFTWDPSQHQKLIFEAKDMLPLSSATDDDMELALIISPTDRQRIVGFWLKETGPNALEVRYNTGGGYLVLATGLQNDAWVALRGELDLTTSTCDVFVNNAPVGSDLPILPGMSVSQIGALFLGKGFWHSNAGYYDDVRVWVPEPASGVLLLVGALATLKWRR
jgi:hypothetical protein